MLPRTNDPLRPSVLAAFVRREPSAVRAFYREYGRTVYALTHRVLGRHDLAEEATQQTFVRAWQAAASFDVTRNPAPWLAVIARRVAIDVYRREGRQRITSFARIADDGRAIVSPPPDLGTVEAVWHVRRAIDALPVEEATIVRLQHLDGMSHTQIAEKLGIALGTVKSRSHRAHRKLAARLGHLRESAA
jgi:RNA polymerase sigma-70 factor (ECF subfamily)